MSIIPYNIQLFIIFWIHCKDTDLFMIVYTSPFDNTNECQFIGLRTIKQKISSESLQCDVTIIKANVKPFCRIMYYYLPLLHVALYILLNNDQLHKTHAF